MSREPTISPQRDGRRLALLALASAALAASGLGCGDHDRACYAMDVQCPGRVDVVDVQGQPISRFYGELALGDGHSERFSCPPTQRPERYRCKGNTLELSSGTLQGVALLVYDADSDARYFGAPAALATTSVVPSGLDEEFCRPTLTCQRATIVLTPPPVATP